MKKHIIGLTGGIGSGKSLLAAQFKLLGASVLDADAIVHELYSSNNECKSALVRAFGSEVLSTDGTVDRAALSSIVFANQSALNELNGIVHPLVLNELEIRSRAEEQTVIWDVPLLIESNMTDCVDFVVVVIADREKRIERLMERRGMTEQQICDRMSVQLDDYSRIKSAHYLCINNRSEETLLLQARSILDDIWRRRDY